MGYLLDRDTSEDNLHPSATTTSDNNQRNNLFNGNRPTMYSNSNRSQQRSDYFDFMNDRGFVS